MRKLIFGPYVVTANLAALGSGEVVPSNIQLEWADAKMAASIPIFLHRRPHDSGFLRLENIVFPLPALPFDIECSRYQAVQTTWATLLPMEALLVGLYTKYEVSRSVFQILTEVSSRSH